MSKVVAAYGIEWNAETSSNWCRTCNTPHTPLCYPSQGSGAAGRRGEYSAGSYHCHLCLPAGTAGTQSPVCGDDVESVWISMNTDAVRLKNRQTREIANSPCLLPARWTSHPGQTTGLASVPCCSASAPRPHSPAEDTRLRILLSQVHYLFMNCGVQITKSSNILH